MEKFATLFVTVLSEAYSASPDAPNMQNMNACCIASRPSAPLPLTPALDSNATALNMQLQNTIVSQRHMVRDCVKTKLFRHLKFFKKDVHGLFDLCNGTVCAMIVANCNVSRADVDKTWWTSMRKLVVCTHTDWRNNVVKNIRLRFRKKSNDYLCCNVIAYSYVRVDGLPEGMCGKIPHFKINNGSDADMRYMLDMRNNLVHYVHIIDIYAPCIIGHSHWNDMSKMLQYCGKGGALINEFILSISI